MAVKWNVGYLIVTLAVAAGLITSAVFLLPGQVKISVSKTQTTLSLWNGSAFNASFVEKVQLLQGDAVLKAQQVNLTAIFDKATNVTYLWRNGSYAGGIGLSELYVFDGSKGDPEAVPLKHLATCEKCHGLIIQYSVSGLPKVARNVLSPYIFGKVKVEWDSWPGSPYVSQISSSGTLKLQYRAAEGRVYSFRLFDPTSGFNNPSTVVSSSYTGGTIVWDNPSYAVSFNTQYASSTLTGALGTDSAMLNSTHYGFAIPAGSTINGIVVMCRKLCDYSSEVRDVKAYLLKNYATVGSNLSDTGAGWTTSAVWKNYSNMTGLWGTTWTAEEINADGFGFGLSAEVYAGGGDDLPQIDVCQIMVNYTLSGGDLFAPEYSLNSTNSTLNGTMVSHNLFWSEENISTNLSGYQFGWCNGTYTYNNGSYKINTTIWDDGFESNITGKYKNTTAGWNVRPGRPKSGTLSNNLSASLSTKYFWTVPGLMNTSNCSAIYVGLWHMDDDLDANDIQLAYNTTGNSWTYIQDLSLGTEDTWVAYNLSTTNASYMGKFAIRIGGSTGSGESSDVDDIKIICEQTIQQYDTHNCSDAGASANFTFDAWTPFKNQYNWSNVTKQVPVEVNSTVKWCFKANDTLNNVNSSGCGNGFIFSYNTTASGGSAPATDYNGTLNISLNNGDFNVTQNQTINLNFSVCAVGGNGHQVNDSFFYGYLATGAIATRVNATAGNKPFYNSTGTINNSCGFLSTGSCCSFNVTINATGAFGAYRGTGNVTSNNTYVLANGTRPFWLNISMINAGANTAPWYVGNASNVSAPNISQVVGFRINFSDTAINFTTLMQNQTGAWANTSVPCFNRASCNVTINLTISATRGKAIGWQIFGNDSAGMINQTPMSIITVSNTLPVETMKWPSSGYVSYYENISINWSSSDADSDSMTAYLYINGSFNKTMTGNTTINFSQGNYVLNLSVSDGYNFTANQSITVTFFTNRSLNITGPTQAAPLTATPSTNVSINFTVQRDTSTNITSGISTPNVTIGGAIAQIVQSPAGAGGLPANAIIFQMDDTQGYWEVSAANAVANAVNGSNISMVAEVIAEYLNDDTTFTNMIKLWNNSGAFPFMEVAQGSYNHATAWSAMSYAQATTDVNNANALFTTAGIKRRTTFIPPFDYGVTASINALEDAGFHSEQDYSITPDLRDGITNLPLTIYNGTEITTDTGGSVLTVHDAALKTFIDGQVAMRGYAVIAIHMQDFAGPDSVKINVLIGNLTWLKNLGYNFITAEQLFAINNGSSSGGGGGNQLGFMSGVAKWQVNVTVPASCSGALNLFVNSTFESTLVSDTETSAVTCGGATAPDMNLSMGPPNTSVLRFGACGPQIYNISAKPVNQTSAYGGSYACNNGTATGSVGVALSGSAASGWSFYAANANTFAGEILLTTTPQTIISGLTQGSCAYIWYNASCRNVNSTPGISFAYNIS
jgi:hypothetical protein